MNIDDFIKENPLLSIERYTRPKKSIIYFICEEDGEIIYIGTTMDQRLRFKYHSARIEFYDKPIYLFYYPKDKCKEMESELITRIEPQYNITYNIPAMKRLKRQKESARIRKKIITTAKRRRISHSNFAKLMGVSRQRIHQILTEDHYLQKKTIQKIEKVLNIKL